eukprot:scaffold1577_cov231-Prasinococcus_capsulatus_cf.AAC.1
MILPPGWPSRRARRQQRIRRAVGRHLYVDSRGPMEDLFSGRPSAVSILAVTHAHSLHAAARARSRPAAGAAPSGPLLCAPGSHTRVGHEWEGREDSCGLWKGPFAHVLGRRFGLAKPHVDSRPRGQRFAGAPRAAEATGGSG